MKKVFITGANKGIGFEIARQLANYGFFVYLGCRDLLKGEEAVQSLKAEGLTNIEVVEIDVSSSNSIKKAREEVGKKTAVLDVLINNAGISGGMPQPASSTAIDVIKEVFNTNVFGTIEVTQAFLDLLRKSDSPRIVNVTSGLASLTLHNDPSWRFYKSKSAAYGPSKTVLNAYTVALAYELKDTNFKVNAADPGYTATDFNKHSGTNDVITAAKNIVQYAMLNNDGPTGEFFSWDNNAENGISPW